MSREEIRAPGGKPSEREIQFEKRVYEKETNTELAILRKTVYNNA